MRRVCEYLGITWDPAMLQVALSDGNVGRWRTQFSADTAAEVTGIVGEVIEAYGYG